MVQIISSFKSQFYLQDYPIHPFFKCASSKLILPISVGLDSVDTESSLLERKSNTKSRHTIWGLSTKAALQRQWLKSFTRVCGVDKRERKTLGQIFLNLGSGGTFGLYF